MKRKLLFVDDEIYQSSYYQHALEDAGFDLVAATSTDEAIEFARRERYSAIVLDVMMPPGGEFDSIETAGGFKTGIALARELREIQPDSHIVALTNSTDPEIEAWFTQDEKTSYAHKAGTTPSELIKMVQSRINESEETQMDGTTPKIFISYSWDSDAHKDWVRALADKLIGHGLDVILDQYDLRGGQDRHVFMEKGVREASHVLVVCTPPYVERANDRDRGVGEETSLITPGFYERESTGKEFIPIVRVAGRQHSTPDYLGSLIYVDFSNYEEFDAAYDKLIRIIYDAPAHPKPPKGTRPDLPPASGPTMSPPPTATSMAALHCQVVESEPSDWSYDDGRGIYTFSNDALLKIRNVRKEDFESFHEDWSERFPDPAAYRDIYELYYNNNLIEDYFFVAVDGFRMSIPLPQSGNDLRISQENYRIGKIINLKHGGYDFDDYLNRAGITVDDAL